MAFGATDISGTIERIHVDYPSHKSSRARPECSQELRWCTIYECRTDIESSDRGDNTSCEALWVEFHTRKIAIYEPGIIIIMMMMMIMMIIIIIQ